MASATATMAGLAVPPLVEAVAMAAPRLRDADGMLAIIDGAPRPALALLTSRDPGRLLLGTELELAGTASA